MDGTIIRPDQTIEESTKEAVFTAQEKGIEVFLATGRPIHEIHIFAEMLNIQSFIGYNGALSSYKGKELYKKPISTTIVENIVNVANENQHQLVLYTSSENYFSNLNTPFVKKFIETIHLKRNQTITPEMYKDVLGITIIANEESDEHYYRIDNGIHLSQVNIEGMGFCFDVIRDSVNKGVGVKHVLKYLGISQDEAIAFGDGMNDKEMLETVGEGFAMGNAHPDLFSYANRKTTNVTNSGVYNGLKSLGLT